MVEMLTKTTLFAGNSLRFWSFRSLSFNKKCGILGVPFGMGQKNDGFLREGLEEAPDVFRKTSFIQDLVQHGIDVKDFGNVKYAAAKHSQGFPNMVNYADVMSNNQRVSDAVAGILKDDRTCLTIGGDHSLFAGSVHGHLRAIDSDDLAVVYVDAHADINLSTTTATGNIHGMPVAMSARELQAEWKNCPHWLQPRTSVSLNNVGYIALRSVDPPEEEIIKKYNIAAYTMNDVVELGVAEVLHRVMLKIDPENRRSIHLSIDTDSLDPSEAPSTTCPVPGGLLLRELSYITSILGKTGRVRAIDWVELNVLRGSESERTKTLNAALTALVACFAAAAVSH